MSVLLSLIAGLLPVTAVQVNPVASGNIVEKVFWGSAFLFALFAVLYLAVLIQRRRFYRRSNEICKEFKRRDIANLQQIREKLSQAKMKEAERALSEMEQVADMQFEGRWIPEPAAYFDPVESCTQNAVLYRDLGYLALLCAVLCTLYSFSITIAHPEQSASPIVVLLPGLALVLLALIWRIAGRSLRLAGDRQRRNFLLNLRNALPVFSPDEGSAVLIQEFKQYDRMMAESTRSLTQSIQALSEETLIESVGSSIEKSVSKYLAPSIQASNRALEDLSRELEHRQRSDMETLSERFSQSMSRTIREGIRPLADQVAEYNQSMQRSAEGMDLAFKTLDHYKAEMKLIDDSVNTQVAKLNEQTETWNKSLGGLLEVNERLIKNNESLSELQKGSEEFLAGRMDALSQSILTYCRESKDLIAQLKAENEALAADLRQSQGESERILKDYRHLTQQIVTAAMDLQKNHENISEDIRHLCAGLDHSVKNFNEQMQNGVRLTLSDFDANLAELAERLSHSATAIRDSLARLIDSVQTREEE